MARVKDTAGRAAMVLCLLLIAARAEAETPRFEAMRQADWLRQAELRFDTPMIEVTAGRDAAGAVDGVTTGKWGFHTAIEPDPWWQVDLGERRDLARLVLFNRCDDCGTRNKRIRMLVSDDGEQWTEAWRNPGEMFYGHTDKKPFSVELPDVSARYVRLTLDGTQYLHLDEVEIYATDDREKNIALGKPATQSSTSQWSAVTPPITGDTIVTHHVVETSIARGVRLAEALDREGVDVADGLAELDTLARAFETLPANAEASALDAIYFQVEAVVRRLALSNPLLDFDSILFVKHAPPTFPHMSDQFYCWWQRGGGALCLLKDFKSDGPSVETLTEDWPDGTFLRPDLSFDGTKALFAYARFYPELSDVRNKRDKANIPADAYFHLFEMDLQTREYRQLTHGKYDDFDGRYLPDGRIVFLSTRKGTALQTGDAAAQATVESTMPDSYVRCGGNDFRPVPVFTLHAIDGDGKRLQQISAFENFEWTPSVTHDGRVIYARWDYIDRFNGPFISLWSTNPDGTHAQLLYGNYTKKPQCVFEARAIPNSRKLVFTAAAHHSNVGGSLVLFDRTRGTEFESPLERLTPEVCFPETEGWPTHYYANPAPLSEEYFLVSWSDKKLPPHSRVDSTEKNPTNSMGVYLYDAFGNLVLLLRDEGISCMNPLPVRARAVPDQVPRIAEWKGPQEGAFLLQDVYVGLDGVERGTVKSIRIVGTPPKVQPYKNAPMLGVSAEEPGKYILGTVPVEEDGSAYFRVPSGVPYLFQAIDEDGLAVQTMRSQAYVQPGETIACVGCHESRETTPSTSRIPLAATRDPAPIVPGPDGTWPLRYDRLVQPVLDARCVSCHNSKNKDLAAAKIDLSPAKSYQTLMSFGNNDLKTWAFERDRSYVGETTARNSRLYKLLSDEGGHEGVKLSQEERERIITWMDTYAHHVGSFSDEQERELVRFREEYRHLLEE